MREKRSVNMLLVFTEKRQCTLQLITSVLFKPVWLLFFYSNHMFNIAVVIPFLNVPRCTLFYLIHSQIYFRGVCMTLRKKRKKKEVLKKSKTKCVIVEDISKIWWGTYLMVHNMHACQPDPNWFLALVGFGVLGVWILTLSW